MWYHWIIVHKLKDVKYSCYMLKCIIVKINIIFKASSNLMLINFKNFYSYQTSLSCVHQHPRKLLSTLTQPSLQEQHPFQLSMSKENWLRILMNAETRTWFSLYTFTNIWSIKLELEKVSDSNSPMIIEFTLYIYAFRPNKVTKGRKNVPSRKAAFTHKE